jgi:TonB family protein
MQRHDTRQNAPIPKPIVAGIARTLAVLMHSWLGVTLACVVLSAPVNIHAAQTPPIPDNPLRAQTSLGFNPKTRCPDLRITDEQSKAVVVFWLPRSGIPSKIFIKSPSGSDALDSAAIGCVSKLKFAPATRLGDGDPIDSWQQIGFGWANQGNADVTGAMTAENPLAGTSRAAKPIAGAPAQAAANARSDDSGGQPNSVTVHVCVDESGRLVQEPTIVQSSGKAALDQAAVKIAASGSAYYRPDTSSNGPPQSGCAQLAIKFDVK